VMIEAIPSQIATIPAPSPLTPEELADRFGRDVIWEHKWIESACNENVGCPEYGAPSHYGCEAFLKEDGAYKFIASDLRGGNNTCSLLNVKKNICDQGIETGGNFDLHVRCYSKEFLVPVPSAATVMEDQSRGLTEVQFGGEELRCGESRGCPEYGVEGFLGCEAIPPNNSALPKFQTISGPSNPTCDQYELLNKVCTANAAFANQYQLRCYIAL
jgi:hypothetical protein